MFDNRSEFRGSGFKGYTCWKLLTIVIKIRDTYFTLWVKRLLKYDED